MSISDNYLDADSAVYKTLLESTKAIPWKINWSTLQFSYIGPQIEALLGWSPDSWLTVEDWASRMHPDDRAWVVDFCVAQSKAGTDHEADYRALTKDGQYIWIRDVVHVVRKENGEVDSLIGFMFDITERKDTEQKLIELQKQLEELSFKDGLTGVFNRRMFDSVMEVEWANANRNRQPLSLIMLDIDYFKQYNDYYGHIQGDECLKRVANVLACVATRSRDFFARYGGEEFILVLPETDEAAAFKIAERCRNMIFKAQIPHEKSLVSQLLTISIGISTITPTRNDEAIKFIATVDKQLYVAKEKGRNSIA
ncbi:sensor domain-containing diguanylate cyclase [Methylotenera sp.]|uniref:GGDEF domain-containing protein n=1 Tax=Methylotenera sp. TaxID=2051956 RepID=UPI00273648FD|nr:sensor domain-containing diguanylate cyclase [Methylotenera sp.]MDP3777263.1 sensor domain-containing diguanylate cyclase [Methylotenera sp.]